MIKKIVVISSILVFLFSCKQAKNYATLSGKIDNASVKEISLSAQSGYSKTIALQEDGTFSDTLHLDNKGEMLLLAMNNPVRIYLKNNDDITLTLDANAIEKTIKYSGRGAEVNDYLIKKSELFKTTPVNHLFKLDKADFEKGVNEITDKFIGLLDSYKTIDTAYYSSEKRELLKIPESLGKQYKRINSDLNGKPSPGFFDYENVKGGVLSLNDLKGKYVYIDVWATWCRPCLGEIPHLQKLEEEFKGKDIHFVSISIDKENAKENWKKMIKDKKMGGIQLFAKQNDDFIRDYSINSIPRFILIDPNGVVINSKMSRPSDPSTKAMFHKLLNK